MGQQDMSSNFSKGKNVYDCQLKDNVLSKEFWGKRSAAI